MRFALGFFRIRIDAQEKVLILSKARNSGRLSAEGAYRQLLAVRLETLVDGSF